MSLENILTLTWGYYFISGISLIGYGLVETVRLHERVFSRKSSDRLRRLHRYSLSNYVDHLNSLISILLMLHFCLLGYSVYKGWRTQQMLRDGLEKL